MHRKSNIKKNIGRGFIFYGSKRLNRSKAKFTAKTLKVFLLDVSVNSEINKVCHRKLVLISTELENRWFCYVTAFCFLFRQQ